MNTGYSGSGGGGGGYCGGSGGQTAPDESGTGGGGGSGYGPVGTTFETGVREGDGLIIITYGPLDDIAPVTTPSFSNGYVSGTWTNQPVTVSLTAIDNVGGSGVATIYYAVNDTDCDSSDRAACSTYTAPFTISREGTATLTFFSVDAVGNVEAPQTVLVAIDLTDPVADPIITGTLGSNGWYVSPVSVTWSWEDTTSGIDAANCPTTTSTSTDGEYTVSATCVDLAGNSASASVPVKLDQTPPTVTYTGNAGSYTIDQQITITCTATDATSGIASTTCQNISGPAASFGPGSHTFSATATDYAGHSSSASVTFTVSVDYASLANLTCQMLERPTACSTLSYYLASAEWAEGRHIGMLQQHYLNLYVKLVKSTARHGLSSEQAQILMDLAGQLYPSRR